MKKIAIIMILAMLLVACGNNNTEVINNVAVDLTNVDEAVNENTDAEGTGTEVEDTDTEDTDVEGTDAEDTDAEDTDAEDTDAEGTDAEDTDAEGTDTEGTDTEGTDTEDTDAEDTDTEGTEEVTEPVDYTANISKPYDDVDYAPFEKVESYESNPAINVKGIYVTANTAALDRMDNIIELINNTELNAVVIDVKNDSGYTLFYSKAAEEYVPDANKYVQIDDMEAFMKKMKDNNIYTIARIVTFKSPLYAV